MSNRLFAEKHAGQIADFLSIMKSMPHLQCPVAVSNDLDLDAIAGLSEEELRRIANFDTPMTKMISKGYAEGRSNIPAAKYIQKRMAQDGEKSEG